MGEKQIDGKINTRNMLEKKSGVLLPCLVYFFGGSEIWNKQTDSDLFTCLVFIYFKG